MVTINLNYRPDDLGTRALERENTGPRETKAVSATAPKPAIPGTDARPGPEPPLPALQPRRREQERRKGRDRRQRDIPVLLDTRSKRERRRNPDTTEEDEPPVRGIDVFT